MNLEEKTALRRAALLLLDDSDGISEEGYKALTPLLYATGSGDIANAVDLLDGRAFIGEDVAEDALRDISKWAEAQAYGGCGEGCACKKSKEVEVPDEETS